MNPTSRTQYTNALFAAEAARRSSERIFASVFVGLNVVSLVAQSGLQFAVTSSASPLGGLDTIGIYEGQSDNFCTFFSLTLILLYLCLSVLKRH